MTEVEWLAYTDATPMPAFLRGKARDRKLRRFACACGRRIWHLLEARSSTAVQAVERYADGPTGRAYLSSSAKEASAICNALGESYMAGM
jgi:hypothetical protein